MPDLPIKGYLPCGRFRVAREECLMHLIREASISVRARSAL